MHRASQAAGRGLRTTTADVGRHLDRTSKEADKALDKAGRETGRLLEETSRALGDAGRETSKALGDAGRETGRALGEAGRVSGRALGRAGRETGRALETAVKEPVRIVQDLKEVDVDVLTSVALDLSSVFETDTWVSAWYREHTVRARSELGKLVAEGVREKVRASISDALDGSLKGLHRNLPDLSEQLLGTIPADAPFRHELRGALQERAVSSMWAARFRGDDRLVLTSGFCLNDLLEALISRVLLREQLHRDLLDLAAAQGVLSGNVFDLLPDLRGQFLQAVQDECAGLRRPLQETLDAFSAQECWEARIPERDRVTLSSKFALHELIERACGSLTEADVQQMRPWLREQGGALTDMMPASGVLLLARPALRALLPGFLARQETFFEWNHDVIGAVTVSVTYPTETTDVFRFSVGVSFKRVVALITTRLFSGLPRTLDFSAGAMGRVEAVLEYPAAGDDGISVQVILKGRDLPGIIEEVVEQSKEQISSAVPVKVSQLATSTEEKEFSGSRWTCVNRIRLTLNVVS